MSEIHDFISGLARRVAPEEEDLAADWLDAYLAGGADRAALTPGWSAPGGAFPENLVLAMPAVICVLGALAPQLSELLRDSLLKEICWLAPDFGTRGYESSGWGTLCGWNGGEA